MTATLSSVNLFTKRRVIRLSNGNGCDFYCDPLIDTHKMVFAMRDFLLENNVKILINDKMDNSIRRRLKALLPHLDLKLT